MGLGTDSCGGDRLCGSNDLRDLLDDRLMKVWIYHRGDDLMVFASREAARAWFDKHDPEGVAFAYEVIGQVGVSDDRI